jgi:hypothetical protein
MAMLKDPNAVLDYTFDWTDWLTPVADVIVSVTWLPSTGITVSTTPPPTHTSTTATAFASGGVLDADEFLTCRITTAGDQALEIDEQHHNALLLWMKHLAYDKQDSETLDKGMAAEYEARFRMYCAAALKEQERARRNSGTVIYGGL